jgi:hypothetical protein
MLCWLTVSCFVGWVDLPFIALFGLRWLLCCASLCFVVTSFQLLRWCFVYCFVGFVGALLCFVVLRCASLCFRCYTLLRLCFVVVVLLGASFSAFRLCFVGYLVTSLCFVVNSGYYPLLFVLLVLLLVSFVGSSLYFVVLRCAV